MTQSNVSNSQEKQRFLTDVLHEVMLLDGLSSSHPISQQVFEATDIDRVFDWIAYKKARESLIGSYRLYLHDRDDYKPLIIS